MECDSSALQRLSDSYFEILKLLERRERGLHELRLPAMTLQRGDQVIDLGESVVQEVRAAIQRIGGTLPENIPPAEHIQQVEQRVQSTSPKLVLDDSDARGLSQAPSGSGTTTEPDIPPA